MFEDFLISRWIRGSIQYQEEFNASQELFFLDKQINLASKNTKAMCSGFDALNMFFYGENGLGKSSLVKYLLYKYSKDGLRCIEFLDEDLYSMYELFDIIRKSVYKFFIYFDDLAFENNDKEFRKFKSIIEGSLEEKPRNCIFLVTSNKKHIVNQKVLSLDSDIFEIEEENEKISLFARFGLTIGFHEFGVDEFIELVKYYLAKFVVNIDFDINKEALSFATNYGIRSGRVAKQFALYKFIDQLKI